jgi:hypothetical protein
MAMDAADLTAIDLLEIALFTDNLNSERFFLDRSLHRITLRLSGLYLAKIVPPFLVFYSW